MADNVMFEGEVKIKVTDRGYLFYDVTKIAEIIRTSDQTEKSAATSDNLDNAIISNETDSVNNAEGKNANVQLSEEEPLQSLRDGFPKGDALSSGENDRLRQMFLDALDGMEVKKGEGTENKFSLKDIERYTEDEYNNFGWVVFNNVLNEAEYGHLRHQLSDADNLGFEYKAWKNERRVLVTDNNAKYNKLVCVSKRGEPFKIFSVIEFGNGRKSKRVLESVRLYNGSTSDVIDCINRIAGREVLDKRTRRDYPALSQFSGQNNSGKTQTINQNIENIREQAESRGGNNGTVKEANVQLSKEEPLQSLRDSFPKGDALSSGENDRLRLSLGLEAQNRNLLNRNEEYKKIIRERDVEIRELQRTQRFFAFSLDFAAALCYSVFRKRKNV